MLGQIGHDLLDRLGVNWVGPQQAIEQGLKPGYPAGAGGRKKRRGSFQEYINHELIRVPFFAPFGPASASSPTAPRQVEVNCVIPFASGVYYGTPED
jgi:hypothetical protein